MAEEKVPEWVTDGTHIYPYNEHLLEMLSKGELKVCDAPKPSPEPAELVALRALALSHGYTLPNRCTLTDGQQLFHAYKQEKARLAALEAAPEPAKPTRRRKVQADAPAPVAQQGGAQVAETSGFPA